MEFVRPRVNLDGIRWLVLDVDGTLTDGNVYYGSEGEHLKHFNIHDTAGIMKWIAAGGNLVVISGDPSPSTRSWAKHIGLPSSHLKFGYNKAQILDILMDEFEFDPTETVVMGDDDLDLPLAEMARHFIAPPGSHESILQIADMITNKESGKGAVRELIDLLLVGGEYVHDDTNFLKLEKVGEDELQRKGTRSFRKS